MDVKYAVGKAAEYLQSLYSRTDGLRVEEVKKEEGGEGWLVTLSFYDPDPPANQFVFAARQRLFKEVKMSPEGDFLGLAMVS